MTPFTLDDFVRQSNLIEGMTRPPTSLEVAAHHEFLALEEISVGSLCEFVSVIQPGAVLRDRPGLDVRVGPHVPMSGGAQVHLELGALLSRLWMPGMTPWFVHNKYETLHPFTDGNGRSGRGLWLWMMGGIDKAPLGFLHHFYYQTLQETRE